VDYWATWCAPCQKLGPQIDEFAKEHPNLSVAKLDVSDWDPQAMQRYLPGLPGIPVVDLWGPDGRLVRRLVGPECGDFAAAALALPGMATATEQ
jgi:thioredoxin 1